MNRKVSGVYKAAGMRTIGGVTKLWCNGQWLDSLDFPAAPTDRGLMHGLGLFETILAVGGRPIFADRHVERLRAGCARLGWQPELPADIDALVRELLAVNELGCGRARIRLALSGGSGRVQDLGLGGDHLVWITAVPAAEPPQTTTACWSPWTRNERSALAGLKTASYADNLVALEYAAKAGFEEAVFLNGRGWVCEAATSNVFLVAGGAIRTPSLDSGCLPGITRAVVIGLAADMRIPCEEADVGPEELERADEIFITSSIRGVMGLSRFNGRALLPGPLTGRLRGAWNRAVLGTSPG